MTLAVGFVMVGCKHADDGLTAMRPAQVLLTPKGGGEPVRVYVEVVADSESLRRGLMFRKHLAADKGMLFLMGEEKIHTFWMENTYVSLDMLFIKRDKTLAGVVANTEPLSRKQRFVDDPSFYVLEVNAGWAKQNGIDAGATVSFVGVAESTE